MSIFKLATKYRVLRTHNCDPSYEDCIGYFKDVTHYYIEVRDGNDHAYTFGLYQPFRHSDEVRHFDPGAGAVIKSPDALFNQSGRVLPEVFKGSMNEDQLKILNYIKCNLNKTHDDKPYFHLNLKDLHIKSIPCRAHQHNCQTFARQFHEKPAALLQLIKTSQPTLPAPASKKVFT